MILVIEFFCHVENTWYVHTRKEVATEKEATDYAKKLLAIPRHEPFTPDETENGEWDFCDKEKGIALMFLK